MEWFVEEVLSGEASSQGKNESPSAKVRNNNRSDPFQYCTRVGL